MGLLGDSLWTMDWGLRRLSLFESSGELLGITSTGDEVTGPSNGGSALIYQPMPESLTPTGEVMSYGGVWLKNLTDGTAMRSPILLGPPEGGVLDTIGWYSLKNSGLFLRGLGGPQPIPDFELVVYDGPGGKACVVQRDEVLRAAVVNATVTCLGTDADTLWQRTLAFDVATVPPSVADSIRQWYHKKLRSYTTAEIDAALHIPTYWPPVTEAFAGADGAIWLRGAELRDSVTYTVLDRGGVDRVDVRVPKEIRIRWANGDVVWAEQLDEDDVPTVSRFSVLVPDRRD